VRILTLQRVQLFWSAAMMELTISFRLPPARDHNSRDQGVT
jgi:hypothetical protein